MFLQGMFQPFLPDQVSYLESFLYVKRCACIGKWKRLSLTIWCVCVWVGGGKETYQVQHNNPQPAFSFSLLSNLELYGISHSDMRRLLSRLQALLRLLLPWYFLFNFKNLSSWIHFKYSQCSLNIGVQLMDVFNTCGVVVGVRNWRCKCAEVESAEASGVQPLFLSGLLEEFSLYLCYTCLRTSICGRWLIHIQAKIQVHHLPKSNLGPLCWLR